jgi:hypothetical protein
MSNYALSRLERLYLQVETTYGIVPNSGGTATVADSNCCRFIRMSLNRNSALIPRPDKTGSRSQQIGQLGRRYAPGVDIEMSIAPNGVAGTAPDADPLFQGLFGQAGSALSGTATITGATNAGPIVITATAHGFSNEDAVFISGVTGNTAANGAWFITYLTTNTFSLIGSQGNGAYVSGGTASRVSYVYTLSDVTPIPSLSVWSFRQPSTIDQRVSQGTGIVEANFALGADVATARWSAEGQWINSSNQFSSEDTIGQGGLTAFPTEPSSPVTNGNFVVGFTGSVAVDGYNMATLRTANIRFQNAVELVRDTFGTYYSTGLMAGERAVGITFSLYEDDSTAYQTLITLAQNKTPVDIPLFMGTVSGTIFGILLKNVQIQDPTSGENLRFYEDFPEAMAHATTLSSLDEIKCVFI